jgi:peptide/nickel transport system substrate-binding protein/oligopeptide transport system substrate-binding protein
MDYPSMEDYLDSLYSTTGSSNYYGYSNPRVDALVKDGNQAANPDLAVQKYQQAEDILAQDMPVIPLRFEQDNFGHSARVTNVTLDQYDRVDLTKIAISS